MLLRRIGYNFVPQLRKINVVSIESQNLYKPLTTPGPLKYREWEHKKQQEITHQPPSAQAAQTRQTRPVLTLRIITIEWNRPGLSCPHCLTLSDPLNISSINLRAGFVYLIAFLPCLALATEVFLCS